MAKIGLRRSEPVFHARDAERTSYDLRLKAETLARTRNHFESMSCLYAFFLALERNRGRERLGTEAESAPMDYVEAARMYIRASYGRRDCTVDSMARRLGLTRSYLSTFLRERTGRTPREMLMEYRFSKARELLSATTLPISEIAEAVGYPDPLSFSRAFRKWSSLSPSECRRSGYAGAPLIPDDRSLAFLP
jgi:AraC-like DNA-binding protein